MEIRYFCLVSLILIFTSICLAVPGLSCGIPELRSHHSTQVPFNCGMWDLVPWFSRDQT